MAQRQHSDSGPGLELGVDVHWCTQCGTERTVQIMQLAGDPEPIALCADCGCGVAMWLAAEAGHTNRGNNAQRGRTLARQRGAA